MRVLMFAPGHSIHTQRPIDMLLAEGHDVVLVDANMPHLENYSHFEYRLFPSPRGKRFSRVFGKRFEAWVNDLTIVFQLWRLRRVIQPDVVHIHWVDPCRADQCLRAGLKPMFLSFWGSDMNQYFLPDADERVRDLLGAVCERAQMVIVDTPDVAQKAVQLAGGAVHTTVLSLGVDLERFHAKQTQARSRWRSELNIGDSDLVFLSVRAWGRLYRHDLILEAFAQALPDLPKYSCLILKIYNPSSYRDPAGYLQEILTRIEALGIEENIRWIEDISDAKFPEIYALADVIVNFPEQDAFPISFLEAAGCERLVISNLLPAYQDTFAADIFFMTETNDILGLAVKMVEVGQLLEQKALELQERLDCAKKSVAQNYSQQHYRAQLLALYQEYAFL